MTNLYNLSESDGEYTMTKFDTDYRVEASYVVSKAGCDCPAGNRPTCRHRKMLPLFLREQHVDDGWFLDWDTRLWWAPESGDIADARAMLADQEEIDDAEPNKIRRPNGRLRQDPAEQRAALHEIAMRANVPGPAAAAHVAAPPPAAERLALPHAAGGEPIPGIEPPIASYTTLSGPQTILSGGIAVPARQDGIITKRRLI